MEAQYAATQALLQEYGEMLAVWPDLCKSALDIGSMELLSGAWSEMTQ